MLQRACKGHSVEVASAGYVMYHHLYPSQQHAATPVGIKRKDTQRRRLAWLGGPPGAVMYQKVHCSREGLFLYFQSNCILCRKIAFVRRGSLQRCLCVHERPIHLARFLSQRSCHAGHLFIYYLCFHPDGRHRTVGRSEVPALITSLYYVHSCI